MGALPTAAAALHCAAQSGDVTWLAKLIGSRAARKPATPAIWTAQCSQREELRFLAGAARADKSGIESDAVAGCGLSYFPTDVDVC